MNTLRNTFVTAGLVFVCTFAMIGSATAAVIAHWGGESDGETGNTSAGTRAGQADDRSGNNNHLKTPDGSGTDGFVAANNPAGTTDNFSPTYSADVPIGTQGSSMLKDPVTGTLYTNTRSFQYQDEGGSYSRSNRLADPTDASSSGGTYSFGTTDTTFEFWFKSSLANYTLQADKQLFSHRGGAIPFWNIFFEGDDIRFVNNKASGEDDMQTTLGLDSLGADATDWHHMAVVIDFAADNGGSNEMRVYFDYSLFQAIALDPNTATEGLLGKGHFEVGNASYKTGGAIPNSKSSFVGFIDEFRISNTSLTPGQFLTFAPIPEPSSVALFGMGALMLCLARRRS